MIVRHESPLLRLLAEANVVAGGPTNLSSLRGALEPVGPLQLLWISLSAWASSGNLARPLQAAPYGPLRPID
jgi:hypothetical protein